MECVNLPRPIPDLSFCHGVCLCVCVFSSHCKKKKSLPVHWIIGIISNTSKELTHRFLESLTGFLARPSPTAREVMVMAKFTNSTRTSCAAGGKNTRFARLLCMRMMPRSSTNSTHGALHWIHDARNSTSAGARSEGMYTCSTCSTCSACSTCLISRISPFHGFHRSQWKWRAGYASRRLKLMWLSLSRQRSACRWSRHHATTWTASPCPAAPGARLPSPDTKSQKTFDALYITQNHWTYWTLLNQRLPESDSMTRRFELKSQLLTLCVQSML